jgi:hypothetical protein
VNPEESDAIFDTKTGVRTIIMLNATTPPPQLEDVPPPPPPSSPQAPPSPETNDVTPILNVPRKFSMCINLILDTLKFTTIMHRMNNLYNNEC